MVTREEMREVAHEAADEAVKKLLLALGVDASQPETVIAMQADFRHLRRWREASDAVKRHSIRTAVTILVTGIAGYLLVLIGIKTATPG